MEGKKLRRMNRLHLLLEDNSYNFNLINHDRLGEGYVIPFGFNVDLFVNDKVIVESKNNKILMNTGKDKDYSRLRRELHNLFNTGKHIELRDDVDDFVKVYQISQDLRKRLEFKNLSSQYLEEFSKFARKRENKKG